MDNLGRNVGRIKDLGGGGADHELVGGGERKKFLWDIWVVRWVVDLVCGETLG